MGILINNPLKTKIKPSLLFERGYFRDGWGSPHTRKEKNTKNYNLCDEDNNLLIIWFPKKFEGSVCLGGIFEADVRSRVLIEHLSGHSMDYWLSDPISTMFELDAYIESVLNGEIKSYHGNTYSRY